MNAHAEFNEKWLQQQIASDVTLLSLGDLDAKDIERRQPGFGRLDMLPFDPESSTRYEVEIQLGATDESHIKLYGIQSKVWAVRPFPVRTLAAKLGRPAALPAEVADATRAVGPLVAEIVRSLL